MKMLVLFSVLWLLVFHSINAQEHQTTYSPKEANQVLLGMDESENSFFLTTTEAPNSRVKLVRRIDKTTSVHVMKFNKELSPEWDAAIAVECLEMDPTPSILSYRNPNNPTSIDYLVGYEEFVQVHPGGKVNRVATSKQIQSTFVDSQGSTFVDSRGLNLIYYTGKKKFRSGTIEWHTYAHADLAVTVKTVNLPLPPDTDEENNSHWKIKAVGEEGLYFAYTSYKNEVKEKNRAVLTLHYVVVGYDGSCSEIKSIVLEQDRYIVIPTVHTTPSEFRSPYSFEGGYNDWRMDSGPGSPSSKVTFYANDNAYVCTEFDPVQNRIYTLVARNNLMDEKKSKTPNFNGRAVPLTSISLDAWDMSGRPVQQTVIQHSPPALKATADYSYFANKVRLQALPNGGGVICMLLNNKNGVAWAVDGDGKLLQSLSFTPYSFNVLWLTRSVDKFSNHFRSISDFETSPYFGKRTSTVAALFDRLSEEEKENFYHVSMEDRHVVAVWDNHTKTVQIQAFLKK